uniref:Uncharacterized protein n=1 Tax=viral metagenome TaxID=1070528 RepID=A0A6C0AHV9_9ZZZZ
MLMSWSSPFPEEHIKRPRQKIVSTKQLDTEDDPLSNYTPPKPEPINRKVPEPDSMPNVYDAPLLDTTYKSNESELLEKLNYMISLLEEQRDEKTGQVTEELILYVFLGIFTLFVLDTFVKNGKYSR